MNIKTTFRDFNFLHISKANMQQWVDRAGSPNN